MNNKVLLVVDTCGGVYDQLLDDWQDISEYSPIELSDFPLAFATSEQANTYAKAKDGAVIRVDPENLDDWELLADFRMPTKVCVLVDMYGGYLNDLRVYYSYEEAAKQFEKDFPNCGPYEAYRSWLDWANGCSKANYPQLQKLEVDYPGLAKLDPAGTDTQIWVDVLIGDIAFYEEPKIPNAKPKEIS